MSHIKTLKSTPTCFDLFLVKITQLKFESGNVAA
jgi:hypothetical protein